jgi:hypothetical protein
MPNTRTVVFAALPGSAQLRIFQLVCDSCPPDTPGTCWLAPVCKQWRGLAGSVKRLRVVFQGEQQQQVDNFCAWLRRHVPQVVGVAIAGPQAQEVVGALAGAAAVAAGAAATSAAAAGGPLRLRHLVITDAQLLEPEVCQGTLPRLLAALPHLQHLRLSLLTYSEDISQEAAGQAAVAALGPLQHSTSLTSLVLEGPDGSCRGAVTDAAHTQLLSQLPPTLRSLSWHWRHLSHLGHLKFGHLTALTHLSLGAAGGETTSTLPGGAFTSLRQLRQLEVWSLPVSDTGLLANKEHLVRLELGHMAQPLTCLDQLPHLRSLHLEEGAPVEELLERAPHSRSCRCGCNVRRRTRRGEENTHPLVPCPAPGPCRSTRG